MSKNAQRIDRNKKMEKSAWLDWAIENIELNKSIEEFLSACVPNERIEYIIAQEGPSGWPIVQFCANKKTIEKIEEFYDGLAG